MLATAPARRAGSREIGDPDRRLSEEECGGFRAKKAEALMSVSPTAVMIKGAFVKLVPPIWPDIAL